MPAVGVQAHWQLAANNIIRTMALNEKNTNYELRKRWNNRSKILEESIKKMRFVKVEFLSMMNRYQELAKKQKGSDKLTTFSAATAKSNQMEYPNDGVVWGDDLFKMTAEVKSLCLAGRK